MTIYDYCLMTFNGWSPICPRLNPVNTHGTSISSLSDCQTKMNRTFFGITALTLTSQINIPYPKLSPKSTRQ